MDKTELQEIVKYCSHILQQEKIELLNKKREGLGEYELTKELSRIKEIKKLKDTLNNKLRNLENSGEYNIYCPYKQECELEKRKCEGGTCKEYQWGK